jgi:hypothetical protein
MPLAGQPRIYFYFHLSVICYHATQIVEILHILKVFWVYRKMYAACVREIEHEYSRCLVMSNRICYSHVYTFRRNQQSSFNPPSCPDTPSTTEANNVLLETERSLDLELKISAVRISLPQNGEFIDRSTKYELLSNYLAHSIGTLFYLNNIVCHFPSLTQCMSMGVC